MTSDMNCGKTILIFSPRSSPIHRLRAGSDHEENKDNLVTDFTDFPEISGRK
jgi:hypothetical protein